jgi:hypothetical protein
MRLFLFTILVCFSQLTAAQGVGEAFNSVLAQRAALATNPSWPGFAYARVDTSCVKAPANVTLEKFALIRITPAFKGHFNFSLDHKEYLSPDWVTK